MEALKARIRQEGRILPGNIVKVDSFLNHQVDTRFLGLMAEEFAKAFDISRITKILTAEASGIALAAICSDRFGVPMVFAKRQRATTWRAACIRAKSFPIHTGARSRSWWPKIGLHHRTGF